MAMISSALTISAKIKKACLPVSQGQICSIQCPILSEKPQADAAIIEAVIRLITMGMAKYFQSPNFEINPNDDLYVCSPFKMPFIILYCYIFLENFSVFLCDSF